MRQLQFDQIFNSVRIRAMLTHYRNYSLQPLPAAAGVHKPNECAEIGRLHLVEDRDVL